MNNKYRAVQYFLHSPRPYDAPAGSTVLHLAAHSDNRRDFTLAEAVEDFPDQVNTTDDFKRTPLHWACQSGVKASIDTLVQNGADPFLLDTYDSSTIEIIKRVKRANVVELYEALFQKCQKIDFIEYLSKSEDLAAADAQRNLRKKVAEKAKFVAQFIPHYVTQWIPVGSFNFTRFQQDIIIVAHGEILNDFSEAKDYFRSRSVDSVTFYAPWNCQVDVSAAYAIVTRSLTDDLSSLRFLGRSIRTNGKKTGHYPAGWTPNEITKEDCQQKLPKVVLSPVVQSEAEIDLWARVQFLKNQTAPSNPRNTIIIPWVIREGEKSEKCNFIHVVNVIAKFYQLTRNRKSLRFHLAACLKSRQVMTKDIIEALAAQYGYAEGEEGKGSAISCNLENLSPQFAKLDEETKSGLKAALGKFLPN